VCSAVLTVICTQARNAASRLDDEKNSVILVHFEMVVAEILLVQLVAGKVLGLFRELVLSLLRMHSPVRSCIAAGVRVRIG